MFYWVWEGFYNVSKSIYKVIDGLVTCANKLCGIDPVKVDNQDTDLLSYLFRTDPVSSGFKTIVLIATILLVMFTIIAIIRTITKDKQDGETPGKICIKSLKTLITFMFVPFLMLVLIDVCNAFMVAVFNATITGQSSIGSLLFQIFGQDALYSGASCEGVDYTSISEVEAIMELSDYDFVLSWVAGFVILINIAAALLVFVDRIISLIILFFAAPFSMAASVIDDGQRFKLWRDQVITKFLTGYGTILAINIYALVVSLIMEPGFYFFDNSTFLDFICKLLFIIGGSITMRKSMALVGDLVSSGAGSRELMNNAITGGSIARGLAGVAKTAGGVAHGALVTALHPVNSAKRAFNGLQRSLGFGDAFKDVDKNATSTFTGAGGGQGGGGGDGQVQSRLEYNYGKKDDDVKNAITGNSNNDSNGNTNDNTNQDRANKVSNALNNVNENKKKDDEGGKKK